MVQPLLGVLGGAPDYFIVFNVSAAQVRWFVAALVLLVPLVVLAIESALWRLVRVRDLFHYVVIGSCVTVAVAQVWKDAVGIAGVPYIVLTLALSIVVVSSYVQWKAVREWIAWISIVPILATALFFLSTPAGRYARADSRVTSTNSEISVPVVFLMFDEFPLLSLLDGKGEIDAVRYPNFSRLASLSTWYRNYSSTAEVTQFAIPSMLSGITPRRGLGGTFADHPKTLFSLVAGNHTMNVSEIVTALCPASLCSSEAQQSTDWKGFLRGLRVVMRQRIDTTKKNEMNVFEGFVANSDKVSAAATLDGGQVPFADLPKTDVSNFIAAGQTLRFDSWLKSLHDSTTPSFNYLHILLPHQPWVYLPDSTMYATSEEEMLPNQTAWESKVKEQRHLLQVQYVDTLIGRLLDKLQQSGLFDKSLVVVAADHGASFRPGYSMRFATKDLANATDFMHTPLFIHYPNQNSGTVNDENVENIDVLPMLANALHFTVPWKMDGMLPKDKTGTRATTKTLYLVYDPYDAPKRTVDRIDVDTDVYAREAMAGGFVGSGNPVDALDHLYASTPYAMVRGRAVDSFTIRDGTLRFTIDQDVKNANQRILVRGALTGSVSSDAWFAVAVGGRIVGLSPLVQRDGLQRLVSLVYPTAKNPACSVFRIIDSSTLERVVATP